MALSVVMAVVSIACTPEIPDATYVCATTAECPPGLACDPTRGLCVREPRIPDAGCTPLTCELVRAECGTLEDGCGGTLSCGTCTAPETCGGDGSPNICGCTPRECDPGDCGVRENGCGALMNCGGCDLPQICDEDANRCSCTPIDPCIADPKSCGMQSDGCGGTVVCNVCMPPEMCGGGGHNICGTEPCVPKTCAGEGKNCGTISDGCGRTLECGTCSAPASCGGGPDGSRVENVCGCTPRTCATTTRVDCGTGMEECGTTIDCGSCAGGNRCVDNACVCDPLSEPNDHPSTATAVTVPRGHAIVGDQNVHVAGDQDFLTFEPSFTVFSGSSLNVSVSVPGTLDLGVWTSCAEASDVEATTCAAPSSYDTSYSAQGFPGGCVAARTGTSFRTTVSMTVGCRTPTFLVRAAGAVSCSPYDVVIDVVPIT